MKIILNTNNEIIIEKIESTDIDNLGKVVFPKGNIKQIIKNAADDSLQNLRLLNIPDTVSCIDDYAFNNLNISKVVFPPDIILNTHSFHECVIKEAVFR